MMLSVLLVMAVPVRAGSIQFGDVVQTIVDGQNGRSRTQLRLRNISQSGRLPLANGVSSTSGSTTQDAQNGSQQSGGATTTTSTEANSSSTVTVDTAPVGQGPTGQVQSVDLGDVQGTVCDCGEIPLPAIKGGFPLWPLLAGIPLICVSGICSGDSDEPDCVVNCGPPPPPPPSIPEPATLLLFGSGLLALGARARRRRPTHGDQQQGEETAVITSEV
jgi:hypothetical protein